MLISRTKISGFTLIELMIGIAIFAITISMGIPSYRQWMQNTQIRNAAESIQNGLQRARSEAVKRNTNVALTLGADSSWQLNVVNGGELLEDRHASEGSKSATIDITPAGATTITFNSLGLMVSPNPDGSAPISVVVVDSSVLTPQESRELQIQVGLGGSVKICDPNLVNGSSPLAC